MPTQGERQDYLWRPNDYSSTTLAKYDQEAEHWHRAFKNSERKNKPTNYKGTFDTIGLLISFVFSLLMLIVLSIVKLVKWLNK